LPSHVGLSAQTTLPEQLCFSPLAEENARWGWKLTKIVDLIVLKCVAAVPVGVLRKLFFSSSLRSVDLVLYPQAKKNAQDDSIHLNEQIAVSCAVGWY
jgi:hypothetical protein